MPGSSSGRTHLHVQVRHAIDVEHRRGLAALVAVPKLHLSEECLGTRLAADRAKGVRRVRDGPMSVMRYMQWG